jgi:hypothetical protein
MAARGFEVPKNERIKRELPGVLKGAEEAARAASEAVQNGAFTGPIPGPGRVEKAGLSWYNFDSRQSNLSIRHFNNLKSIQHSQSGAGLGRVFKVIFQA